MMEEDQNGRATDEGMPEPQKDNPRPDGIRAYGSRYQECGHGRDWHNISKAGCTHPACEARTLNPGEVPESPFKLSPGYVLIRRRGGWSISCAACGGYNIHWKPDDWGEALHVVLDLHSCGEAPF